MKRITLTEVSELPMFHGAPAAAPQEVARDAPVHSFVSTQSREQERPARQRPKAPSR